ncbi:MAG: polyphosphate:AMP phosphotransferase [Verrucomicrobiales bacterium]|nr:polyphosphate:AMP phosphotransferase [Verrucomicrobiales bacterium]
MKEWVSFMFDAAELGRTLSKREFDRRLPELRARLVEAQFALKSAGVPVVVIISGVDGAGKGDVVHRLNEWLDPRGLDTHSFEHEIEGEKTHPPYWHFWQALPTRGRIALMFGSWYTQPVIGRVHGEIKNPEFDSALKQIAFFEDMLIRDGALIVKLWFHLSKKALHERLKSLRNDPETHWRVLPSDWAHRELYDKFTKASERAIRETDTDSSPWHIIEASDDRHRDYTAARTLLEALLSRLRRLQRRLPPPSDPLPQRIRVTPVSTDKTILDRVDLSCALSEKEYEKKLVKYQAKLNRLTWAAQEKKTSTVIVFEGWDAAGKGSCIRRVTAAIDPRLFRVVPIAAPNDEERSYHYLWRFWRRLPACGRVTIFDRSWYGRVLVERVEGYARPEEWARAYREINDFEQQIREHGGVLAKFWIHISPDEQFRRFKEREVVPFKKYKITPEDWRNRGKWDHYKAAVNDMVEHTSTEYAPWTLVAGNDKRYARIQILKTLCRSLEEVL